MKKLCLSAVFFCFIAVMAGAQELNLNEILNRYYKASGIDKWQNVSSVIMTGTITQNDIMPVKIIRMRPDKYFMEFDVADLTAYQVYDGQTAWMTTPWTGNPKPQVMPPDRANEFKSRADFDGLLYNWQAKGLKEIGRAHV